MILQSRTRREMSRYQDRCRTLVRTATFLLSLLVVSEEAVVAQPGPGRKVSVPSNGIHALAYSRNGKQIAGGSSDATVKIWNANSGELERSLIGHNLTVRTVAFAPRGSVLASGSDDKTVILWDANTGKRLRTLGGFARDIFAMKFTTDGNTLWTGSSDLIAWDVATGRKIATIPLGSLYIGSIDISPDGSTVAVSSLNKDKSMSARIFDIQTGNLLRSIGGKDFGVYEVCFLSDGKHLAGTTYNQTVASSMRVWNTASGKVQKRFNPEFKEIWAIGLSPNGNLIATGGEGSVVETFAPRGKRVLSAFTIWELKSGKAKISQDGSLGRVTSICFSPDNKRLAYCDHATVRVIEVASGDEVWSGKYGLQ